jgi:hypothetical protein
MVLSPERRGSELSSRTYGSEEHGIPIPAVSWRCNPNAPGLYEQYQPDLDVHVR